MGAERGARASPPLVLGSYKIREHIASGGMSQVYRALHSSTDRLVAVKVVPLESSDEIQGKKMLREIRIHETLKHQNILELIGGESKGRSADGRWPEGLYIVLDLASGGDLFDKISPDFGVDEDIAHLYFRQLIAGLKYLGTQGICHRDIKPENCLLDGNGNLKISDFGLASVFKYKGRSRLLQERCGSPPYAAPELAAVAPYAGEPVDIWSAGILLFALLVGNTPWDEPTQNAPEFAAYISGALVDMDPWDRIRGSSMALLLRLLTVNPAERITIPQMEKMDWYRQANPLMAPDGSCADGAYICARLLDSLRRHGHLEPALAAFEPATQRSAGQTQSQMSQTNGLASFMGSMKLYSKLSMAPSQKTNPNLNRFFSTTPLDVLVQTIESIFRSLSIPLVQTLRDPSSAEEVRVRFRHTDHRRQNCYGAVKITKSVLPFDDDEGGSEMDVDAGEEQGTPGFDVVCWKKQADPLELRKLWKEVMNRIPPQMIFAR